MAQDKAKLGPRHDPVAGEVLRLQLASLFAPFRRRAPSSSPVVIRAFEPPMKWRRSAGYARQIRSRARTQPFGTEQSDREVASRPRPRWPGSLAQAAEKGWHRLRGHYQLPKVILGVKFNKGIEVVKSQAQAAAA